MRSLHSDISASPMRNLNPYPIPDASNIDYNSPWGSGQSTAMALTLQPNAWGNYAAMRATLTNAAIATSIRMGFTSISIPAGWNTYRYRVRASAGLAGQTVDSRIRYGGSTTNIISTPIVITAEWQEIVITRNLSLAAPDASVQIIITANQGVNGDYVEVTALEWVAERGIRGTYADGNTPFGGWKWDGAPNASTSVGYPYLLSTIVGGQPWLDLSGIGVVSDIGNPLAPDQDRLVLTVFDISDTTVQFPSVTALRTGSQNASMRLYGNRSIALSYRAFERIGSSTVAGEFSDFTLQNGNPSSVGRHVAAMRTNGGMTGTTVSVTRGDTFAVTSVGGAINAIKNHAADRLENYAGEALALRSLAYRNGLDDASVLAAMRWMATAYGARIA